MNNKVIAIIGLAAAIAVSSGVVAITSDNVKQNKQADKTSAATSAYTDPIEDTPDDVIEGSTQIVDFTEGIPEETETEANAAPTGSDSTVEPSVPFEEQIISETMTVKFIVDHSTGAEASPRVVFGEGYTYCYAAFDSDKSFEMCLDPASGAIRRGTYQIYDDIIAVEYDDGVASEYDILTDEYGNITHIIVNYGDYNVYFGV